MLYIRSPHSELAGPHGANYCQKRQFVVLIFRVRDVRRFGKEWVVESRMARLATIA